MKFLEESIALSRSSLMVRVLALKSSLVLRNRDTGEELRPAMIAATDEKLFRFRHSCIIVSHESKLVSDNHLQLRSEANVYTPVLLALHHYVAK